MCYGEGIFPFEILPQRLLLTPSSRLETPREVSDIQTADLSSRTPGSFHNRPPHHSRGTSVNLHPAEPHSAPPSSAQASRPRCVCVCVCAQSCPTLCGPTDCSPPGSSVHGLLLPCPPPGDLPDPGIKPASLALLHWQAGS